MRPSLNRALFERNARACENARHPKCTCACGGALHGKSHAAALDTLWSEYLERERERDPQQRLDLQPPLK